MKNKVIKNCLFCAVFALFANNLSAQYVTALTITDIDQSVAGKMEANASALLTELNQAFFDGRTPQLTKIRELSREGRSSILSMWEMTPFRCIETEITERGYNTPTGYQVRNILLFLKDMPEDEAYKNIAINFDRSGTIEDIYFTLDILINGKKNGEILELPDSRRRNAIDNFLEKFRMAYYRKDIDLIDDILTDDMGSSYVFFSEEKKENQERIKEEYINSLRSVFKNNTKINVVFDHIEVVQHPTYDQIYGSTLKASWNTSNYSDVIFLFFLIDFKDGENMQILESIWSREPLTTDVINELMIR